MKRVDFDREICLLTDELNKVAGPGAEFDRDDLLDLVLLLGDNPVLDGFFTRCVEAWKRMPAEERLK